MFVPRNGGRQRGGHVPISGCFSTVETFPRRHHRNHLCERVRLRVGTDGWRPICRSVVGDPCRYCRRPSLANRRDRDVHARQLDAHYRQHDVPLGIWPRSRGRDAAATVPGALPVDLDAALSSFPRGDLGQTVAGTASAADARRCHSAMRRETGGAKNTKAGFKSKGLFSTPRRASSASRWHERPRPALFPTESSDTYPFPSLSPWKTEIRVQSTEKLEIQAMSLGGVK